MRDDAKRAAIRRLLRFERWQRAGEREIAERVGCGRYLVGAVRREMIAAKLIPVPEPGGNTPARVAECQYKPGTSARGGYVYDEEGRAIQKWVWMERQRKKARGR